MSVSSTWLIVLLKSPIFLLIFLLVDCPFKVLKFPTIIEVQYPDEHLASATFDEATEILSGLQYPHEYEQVYTS